MYYDSRGNPCPTPTAIEKHEKPPNNFHTQERSATSNPHVFNDVKETEFKIWKSPSYHCNNSKIIPKKFSHNVRNTPQNNPIGWLQETCISRIWPLPCYKEEYVRGLSHKPHYTVSCRLLMFYEIGTANSKQLAKYFAAYKICQKIQEAHVDENVALDSWEENDFYQSDTNSSPMDDTDYVNMLDEMAYKEDVELDYIPIGEMTSEGKFQYLIKLSFPEFYKCFGEGNTKEQAQMNAARCAIECLKFVNSFQQQSYY